MMSQWFILHYPHHGSSAGTWKIQTPEVRGHFLQSLGCRSCPGFTSYLVRIQLLWQWICTPKVALGWARGLGHFQEARWSTVGWHPAIENGWENEVEQLPLCWERPWPAQHMQGTRRASPPPGCSQAEGGDPAPTWRGPQIPALCVGSPVWWRRSSLFSRGGGTNPG
jgi:hypothetical protein